MEEKLKNINKCLRKVRDHEIVDDSSSSCSSCLGDPPFEGTRLSANLFVGSVSEAMYPSALKRENIVGIINMAGNQLKLIQRMNAAMDVPGAWSRIRFDIEWYRAATGDLNFEYLIIDAEDHPKYKISDHFLECHEFVKRVTKNGGSVLIHCVQGLNRSVAVAVAELVFKGSSLEEAIELVSCRRKGKLLSNKAFVKQLITYFSEPVAETSVPVKSWFQIGDVVERKI